MRNDRRHACPGSGLSSGRSGLRSCLRCTGGSGLPPRFPFGGSGVRLRALRQHYGESSGHTVILAVKGELQAVQALLLRAFREGSSVRL